MTSKIAPGYRIIDVLHATATTLIAHDANSFYEIAEEVRAYAEMTSVLNVSTGRDVHEATDTLAHAVWVEPA